MTALGLRPYQRGDEPPPGSVPVTVVVLTLNEAVNIGRCLESLRWADQVVVLDSGSADGTVALAQSLGADVVTAPWRGYGAQRELALRLEIVRHDWVYFVDADEWVSGQLAAEIAGVLADPRHDAYAHRFRLVFQGRWIRHCGWYGGAWIVRLMRRSRCRFGADAVGERVQLSGSIGRLTADIVDEDLKGLASWLHKHVRYAELEAARRRGRPPFAARWKAVFSPGPGNGQPLLRAIAKELVFPLLPARGAMLFLYMYVLRRGFADGRQGLLFCQYHAWLQLTISALGREGAIEPAGAAGEPAAAGPRAGRRAPRGW
jgi:glycosyltransferase involved in cell wall biosynthesis